MTEKQIVRLAEENRVLREALALVRPIVAEAFWDHHTAGTMPGSGYHHKVYREVSRIFGWRDTKKFKEWEALASLEETVSHPVQTGDSVCPEDTSVTQEHTIERGCE